MFGNASGLLNLILFVFLLTFLASIFASQLFRGEIPEEDGDGDTIRISFSHIFNSFIGMYQIFSSENWTGILFNVTRYQEPFGTAWIGASFCILWFIFANCRFRASSPNPSANLFQSLYSTCLSLSSKRILMFRRMKNACSRSRLSFNRKSRLSTLPMGMYV